VDLVFQDVMAHTFRAVVAQMLRGVEAKVFIGAV
jgi:hypothetical protein